MKINEIFNDNKMKSNPKVLRINNKTIYEFKIGEDTVMLKIAKTLMNSDVYEVGFIRNGSDDITGGGNSIPIFSEIVSILVEFIKNNNVDAIIFSGKKNQNRERLYMKMSTKLGSMLNYNVKELENYAPGVFTLVIYNNIDTLEEINNF